MKKIVLHRPDHDEQQIITKSIDLADRYLIQERWASHQSVFKAVLEIFHVSYPTEALRILSGFSAGGGFSGGSCGALSGGLAALGYIYGREGPIAAETYQRFLNAIITEELSPAAKAKELLGAFAPYFVYNKMVESFKNNFGHTECRELISPFSDNPVSRRRFGNCRRIVRKTAGLTVAMILKVENKKIEPNMGENLYSYLL